MDLLPVLLISILLILIIYLFIKSRYSAKDVAKIIERDLQEMFPQLLNATTQHLITLADQKLVAQSQDIKTDLVNKKNSIEDIVKRLHDEVEKSNRRIEEAERQRIGSFSQLKTELESQRKITEQLSATADGLKKVLSNNQLRGQFGEQVAADLLKMCGFVKGIDYLYNKELKSGESRPDYTILLPDGVKINVDVKFPYKNLQSLVQTDDIAAKAEYKKAFEADIKDKVKQVTTRDYINPQDNTVDFVILFIPNEMIFSFIYDTLPHIWEDAMKKKVIFAGPFNFTATLRLIRQSYSNFAIQKGISSIVSQIRVFEEEFYKFNIEFEKIGSQITSLSQQYDVVNKTRSKKLVSSIDKIILNGPQRDTVNLQPTLLPGEK